MERSCPGLRPNLGTIVPRCPHSFFFVLYAYSYLLLVGSLPGSFLIETNSPPEAGLRLDWQPRQFLFSLLCLAPSACSVTRTRPSSRLIASSRTGPASISGCCCNAAGSSKGRRHDSSGAKKGASARD